MRQAAQVALKGGSASNALALRTSIQQMVAQPTADGYVNNHDKIIPCNS
jgi:hypothetical protein